MSATGGGTHALTKACRLPILLWQTASTVSPLSAFGGGGGDRAGLFVFFARYADMKA